ncbi:MAG: RnfH family protein [Enterobacterales bacterium]|nr:RnfH family protein [Enterobacterales bacterium]
MPDQASTHQALIQIELIYALAHKQKLINLNIAADASVEQAIEQSEILKDYPEIDLQINKVGIFSRVCQLSDGLHDGDRIEIYRPLIIDPKEARKKRALKNK